MSRDTSYYLESGHWFLSLYNDGASEQLVTIFVLLYDDNGQSAWKDKNDGFWYGFSPGRVHHHSIGGLDVCLPKGMLRWDFDDEDEDKVDDYDDLTSLLEKT